VVRSSLRMTFLHKSGKENATNQDVLPVALSVAVYEQK
jgi:hypothetical protein